MKVRYDPADYAGPRPRFGLCLLHGNDPDLIEERAADLTRRVAGSLDDPFRVTTLSQEEHARIPTEVTARSLSGGQRVVRVRDCADRLAPVLARLGPAAGTGTVVVLMGAVLTKRSKLRSWAEEAPDIAAILCNTDDAAQRRAFVDETMARAGLAASRETKALLLERLPPGRRSIVAEVEKLALSAGGGELDWDDALALLEGDAGGTVQAAIDAALAGEVSAALTGWEQAIQTGTSGVGLVRVLGGELGRLTALRAETDRGTPVAEALQRQWIYPRDPRFRRWTTLVRLWTAEDVMRALALVHAAEAACKSTGSDERLVVADLLASLSAVRAAVNRSG